MSDEPSRLTNRELTSAYADVRSRCLDLGRSLSEIQASTMSPCCPAWSVKDLFAHMTGVPVDILEGNTEGAATEAWADAQVQRRHSDSLAAVCDEWSANAGSIDKLLEGMATELPPQFFLDAWTHEWDLRQAVGASARPDLTLPAYVAAFLLDAVTSSSVHAQHPPVELTVSMPDRPLTTTLGTGTAISGPTMDLFEFTRVTMGRRHIDQITAIAPGVDPDVLVFWSANKQRIDDPVEV